MRGKHTWVECTKNCNHRKGEGGEAFLCGLTGVLCIQISFERKKRYDGSMIDGIAVCESIV